MKKLNDTTNKWLSEDSNPRLSYSKASVFFLTQCCGFSTGISIPDTEERAKAWAKSITVTKCHKISNLFAGLHVFL